MAGEITNLAAVPGMGAALEYQGMNDPRWSQSQLLVVGGNLLDPRQVTPQEVGDTHLATGVRSASLKQIGSGFSLQPHQRLVTDNSGHVFVVNAIFREPCTATSMLLPLSPLPSQLEMTPEEMDVLGPWLRLKRGGVCDDGDNILDANSADGIDHRYQTSYNWNDFQSVTDLYVHLENFRRLKNGEVKFAKEDDSRKSWSTDFDDARLQALIDQTEARSKELFDQLPHKQTTWEKLVDSLITGTGFFIPSAVGGTIGWFGGRAFTRFMAKRALVAGGAALVDGPVPAGDVVGGAILLFSVGEFMWNYDEIAAELEN